MRDLPCLTCAPAVCGAGRSAYLAGAPTVIRATGGRLQQLPPVATSHYLSRILTGIRTHRPELPFVRLPSPWDSSLYPVQRPHVAAGRGPAVVPRRRSPRRRHGRLGGHHDEQPRRAALGLGQP